MPGHNYWIEEGQRTVALNTRGLPANERQLVVYLDPPRENDDLRWAPRRSATHMTFEEAGRLVRALQAFLVAQK